MKRIRGLLHISFILLSTLAAFGANAEEPDWGDVSAILNERCIMCHSSTHGAGLGLRLDTYEAAVAGSEKGAVLVPGDAASSELIRRLRGENTPRMPFLSTPLPQEQIELIMRWVDAGLPDIRGHDTESRN